MFKKKKQTPELNRVRRPTLERSTPSSVFSYHANRSAARPGVATRQERPGPEAVVLRSNKQQRFVWARRGPVAAVLVIGIVLTLFNLYLSDTPQVIPVSTTKSAIFLRNQQAYDAAAHAALDKAFWNGNKLTINTDRITADLRAQFPELAGVTVSVPFAGNRVRVYVEPATPQLLLSSNNTLYVVDTSGRALIAAAQVPRIEKLGLPVVNDQTGLPVEAGKAALPSTSVAFITEIVAQLKAKSITISSLTLPAGTSEMDVRISGVGYFVKFNLQGNAREEAGAFLAVKKQLERDRITPQTYIDVRVEERAYYR